MKPEYRMQLLPIGAILLPAGFFIYGWTAQYRVHWIVPILATTIIGLGNMIIFMVCSDLLDKFHDPGFEVFHVANSRILCTKISRSSCTSSTHSPSTLLARLAFRPLILILQEPFFSDQSKYGLQTTLIQLSPSSSARSRYFFLLTMMGLSFTNGAYGSGPNSLGTTQRTPALAAA